MTAFGIKHPEATLSMVLYWPVGGAGFRLKGHGRFARHLALVEQEGLAAVVELAKNTDAGFGKDPRLAACRTFDVSPLFSTIALFSSKL